MHMSFTFYLILVIVLVGGLILFAWFYSSNSTTSYLIIKEQNTSFECGFDQFNKNYLGFCIQFIKTAFLFLLVDLEIALLLPLFINTPLYEKFDLRSLSCMVLIYLTLFLILWLEASIGGLNWREDI